MPLHFHIWIILTYCCIGVTLALLNTTIPAELNRDVVLPCRLRMTDPYRTENVRWFSKKDGWLTDGKTVYKHRNLISVEKPAPNEWNLRIKRVTTSFEDIYTCQTARGQLVSYIMLAIETPPRITDEDSSPIKVTVTENTMAILKCAATGIPEPEIVWYRGVSEKSIGLTGPLLKIRDAPRFATNEYICRARNRNGEAERRITLTVNFVPKVNVMETEVFAAGGEVAVMSCAVQALPLYEVYWTRGTDVNGAPIKQNWKYIVMSEIGGDNIPVTFLTLIIRKSILTHQDYGMYSCVGRGENSVAMDTVELKEGGQQLRPRKKGKI